LKNSTSSDYINLQAIAIALQKEPLS